MGRHLRHNSCILLNTPVFLIGKGKAMSLRTPFIALLLAVCPASGALAATIILDLSAHFGSDPSSGPVSATLADTGTGEAALTLHTSGLNLSPQLVLGWCSH